MIGHGVLAGVAGGVAMAMALLLLGEGPLGRAIALEAAQGGPAADAPFGRGAQQAGGGLAALLYGAALGAVFAVVFAAVRRRLRIVGDWQAAMALAATALVTIFVVPFAKYPANPPTVGDPETIAQRTVLYLAAIGWSVVATWATWRLWRALSPAQGAAQALSPAQGAARARSPAQGAARARSGPKRTLDVSRRAPLTAVAYVALVSIGLAVLPSTPDPVDAPANLIWQFRMASLAGASALWAVLGTTFGWLCTRTTTPAGAAPVRQPAP